MRDQSQPVVGRPRPAADLDTASSEVQDVCSISSVRETNGQEKRPPVASSSVVEPDAEMKAIQEIMTSFSSKLQGIRTTFPLTDDEIEEEPKTPNSWHIWAIAWSVQGCLDMMRAWLLSYKIREQLAHFKTTHSDSADKVKVHLEDLKRRSNEIEGFLSKSFEDIRESREKLLVWNDKHKKLLRLAEAVASCWDVQLAR